MNLVNLFNPGLIVVNADAGSRKECVHRLLEKILETYSHLDKEFLLKKIEDRESLSTTIYPNGIAIPHARIDNLNDLIISVLIPKVPIREVDAEIRIMFLILADNAKSNLYLNVLATIIRLCEDEAKISALRKSITPDDFIRIISEDGLPVKQIIFAKDIMTPPHFLYPHSTVKEAIDFMSRYNITYIPICNEAQKLVGEITIYDILNIGLPPYTQMLKNIKFLSKIEPLEDLLKNEEHIPLSSIMRKPFNVISPETHIIDAVFQFAKNSRQYVFPGCKRWYMYWSFNNNGHCEQVFKGLRKWNLKSFSPLSCLLVCFS